MAGMTGHQLIAALMALPEKVLAEEVITEGCDCWGQVGKVEDWEGKAFLARGSVTDVERDAEAAADARRAQAEWYKNLPAEVKKLLPNQ